MSDCDLSNKEEDVLISKDLNNIVSLDDRGGMELDNIDEDKYLC